jgi:hypothetical protein
MSEREQLKPISWPMSEREHAKSARVLRDEELDAVSGGSWRPKPLYVSSLLETMSEDSCNI